ncbi:hypothetical protein GTCCBUS3UF5_29650 [Geobacillus thermoleovorans CCB_US3_UF5]|uniref:Uncharacterized protein n=1 Tax=Geobacillus thermoleovorans CCB_US3_UF5 TaxID=1111068 RepID=A0ABM5MKL5_GEOTH|nr:hypothetical protein GTCCBUS3UF5_29650 [Geobacillus thermoleovorans CCB_US3_UF5]
MVPRKQLLSSFWDERGFFACRLRGIAQWEAAVGRIVHHVEGGK